MAQIVQAYRRETGRGDEALEEVGDLARVEPGVVLLGADEPGVRPGRAPLRAVGFLLLAMPLQNADGVLAQDKT